MSLATQVGQRIKFGTTVDHATYTGLPNEITVDTDKMVLVVHDGVTAGGHPLAAESAASELPVGSVFVTDTMTNPAGLLGYGTWSYMGSATLS